MYKIYFTTDDFGEMGIKVTFLFYANTGILNICFDNIYQMEEFYGRRRDLQKDKEKAAEYDRIRAVLAGAAILDATLEKTENDTGKLLVYLSFYNKEKKEAFKKGISQIMEDLICG